MKMSSWASLQQAGERKVETTSVTCELHNMYETWLSGKSAFKTTDDSYAHTLSPSQVLAETENHLWDLQKQHVFIFLLAEAICEWLTALMNLRRAPRNNLITQKP